ncbi:MAG TPA: 1,2-phenylacetyl-CoA epoxidase subunit PaaE [Nocardioides sp.]
MARRATFHPLRVGRVDRLTDDSVALSFEVPDDLRDAYRFTPGQHLTLRCADGVRRSYSICSTPGSGELRIGIRQLPDGWFSRGVVPNLEPGDTLDVMTPEGRFTVDPVPETSQEYVAVAAGSGITPLPSIIGSVLAQEPGSRFTLVYANRTQRSVMFLDELHDLKDRHLERFRILHVLSREQQESELLTGRLDAARFGAILDSLIEVATVDDWFLCGPQEMVAELSRVLAERGADQVHSELFHADPMVRSVPTVTQDDSERCDVTVLLDGRSTDLRLGTGEVPVLEAALQLRPELPFACRGGVCGTCRARVVEGSVAMDTNWALEADEVEAGYVLTCQSHPTSSRVVLDYDG